MPGMDLYGLNPLQALDGATEASSASGQILISNLSTIVGRVRRVYSGGRNYVYLSTWEFDPTSGAGAPIVSGQALFDVPGSYPLNAAGLPWGFIVGLPQSGSGGSTAGYIRGFDWDGNLLWTSPLMVGSYWDINGNIFSFNYAGGSSRSFWAADSAGINQVGYINMGVVTYPIRNTSGHDALSGSRFQVAWSDFEGDPDHWMYRMHAVDLDTDTYLGYVDIDAGSYNRGYGLGDYTVMVEAKNRTLWLVYTAAAINLYEGGTAPPIFLTEFNYSLHAVWAQQVALTTSGVSLVGDRIAIDYTTRYGLLLGAGGKVLYTTGRPDAGEVQLKAGLVGASVGPTHTLNADYQGLFWGYPVAPFCVVPPLRMYQRDDGLGKVGSNAPRLTQAGQPGSSKQTTKVRLATKTDEGQAYL